jgi:3'-phosphoadenosine 5'-phosphosulfate sulfotransferase (PAPS reductase)/FAD synthetase
MSWAAFEATWRRHAQSSQFADAVGHAMGVIGDAMADRSVRWYAGISGGKDSLALAWLLSRHPVGKHVKLAHAACELHTPGITECSESAAVRLGADIDIIDVEMEPHADVWEFLRSICHLNRDKACLEMFRRIGSDAALVQYQYSSGFNGAMTGMRAEESRGRKANTTFHGEIYRLKSDGTWMCNPISTWKSRDTWAALIESGLEYPEHYRRLYERFAISPESQSSRVGTLVVTERVSTFNGAMQTARVLYPELWRKIRNAAPALAE